MYSAKEHHTYTNMNKFKFNNSDESKKQIKKFEVISSSGQTIKTNTFGVYPFVLTQLPFVLNF